MKYYALFHTERAAKPAFYGAFEDGILVYSKFERETNWEPMIRHQHDEGNKYDEYINNGWYLKELTDEDLFLINI